MAKLLVFAVFLTLVTVGLCKKSENCQFILYNDTAEDFVLVRMKITAEFKIEYNQTNDRINETTFPLECVKCDWRVH